jgi:hypothetical protein
LLKETDFASFFDAFGQIAPSAEPRQRPVLGGRGMNRPKTGG